MSSLFRLIWKGLALGIVILIFSLHSLWKGFLTRGASQGGELKRGRQTLIARYSKWALKVLGIRVQEVYQTRPPSETGGRLLVCNHLSYLDVLVIASVYPAIFVTSVEVRDTLFLGQMARLAGSIFVERRDRTNVGMESAEISQALSQGLNVVLFPEATSSNGETVLPFKRSFFGAALTAQREVIALCMRYSRVNGRAMSPAVRDSVYYYGDLVFFPQLLAVLKNHEIVVELRTLAVIPTTSVATRDSLCESAYSLIQHSYSYPAYQSAEA